MESFRLCACGFELFGSFYCFNGPTENSDSEDATARWAEVSRETDPTSLGFKSEYAVSDEPLIIIEFGSLLSGADETD